MSFAKSFLIWVAAALSGLWPRNPVLAHTGTDSNLAIDGAVVATVDSPVDGTNNRNHRDLVVRKRRHGSILQMLRFDDDDREISDDRGPLRLNQVFHRLEHARQFRHRENRVVAQTAAHDRSDLAPRRVPELVGYFGKVI